MALGHDVPNMKYLSLILSVALCAFFIGVLRSDGGGRMTPYAGMGRAIMALFVGAISGVLVLVHAIVMAVSLAKGNPLSPIYYASVVFAAIPGMVIGWRALTKSL